MNVKRILKKADFSKETDLKQQLFNRLFEKDSDTVLQDEELQMLNAAKGNTDLTDPMFNPSNKLLKNT